MAFARPRGALHLFVVMLLTLLPGACQPTERSRTLEPTTVRPRGADYAGPRYRLVIGKFENKSGYLRGVFADDVDRLGLQAQQILKNHLAQTHRFVLMDRVNMDELSREATFAGQSQAITGGQMLITGAVTEFGRKEVGASGSLFGKTRRQVAYAKVSLSVVDVLTSQVLFSEQGSGEFELASGDVLGFGSAAGYDATLNDKVLNLAMIEVVDKLVDGLERGQWAKPR